jgi:hypothetical protein
MHSAFIRTTDKTKLMGAFLQLLTMNTSTGETKKEKIERIIDVRAERKNKFPRNSSGTRAWKRKPGYTAYGKAMA